MGVRRSGGRELTLRSCQLDDSPGYDGSVPGGLLHNACLDVCRPFLHYDQDEARLSVRFVEATRGGSFADGSSPLPPSLLPPCTSTSHTPPTPYSSDTPSRTLFLEFAPSAWSLSKIASDRQPQGPPSTSTSPFRTRRIALYTLIDHE